MIKTAKDKYLPFILTGLILAADQISKAAIVGNIRIYTVGKSYFGDFLRIIHTRNPGIAFSLGHNLPDRVRMIVFSVLPLLIMIGVIFYYLKSDDISRFQRWTVAGILGGGFGNLIDRFFRPMGVVDFIDVKFFGLFGLERWPTFNVADASVVVCGILLVLSLLIHKPSAE